MHLGWLVYDIIIFLNLKIKFVETLLQAGFYMLTNGHGQVISRKKP